MIVMRRHYLSYLKNIIIREPSFILKYYTHRVDSISKLDYVYMADGKMTHGGLFDRLKGAVSIYALSKVHHKEFGIFFREPFFLENYLEPHKYDWRIDDDELIYSYPKSRPVIAYSEYTNPERLLRKRRGQTHYYYGDNILDFINHTYGSKYEWGDLFNELFVPSPSLQKYINSEKKGLGEDYIAVHLRFLNLLGDRVEIKEYPELQDEGKALLILDCIRMINHLKTNCEGKQNKVLICSDSMTFLNEAKKESPGIYIVDGRAKHIDTAGEFTEDDILKLFADIFLISGAKKVYSVVGKGMYASAFPKYSAIIGNKPFKRISL